MAESASGQDEANPAFDLTGYPRGQNGPIFPAGDIPGWSSKKQFSSWPYNHDNPLLVFIDQACSVKMAEYWPCSFLRFK